MMMLYYLDKIDVIYNVMDKIVYIIVVIRI